MFLNTGSLLEALDDIVVFASLEGYSVYRTILYVHFKRHGNYFLVYQLRDKWCIENKTNSDDFKFNTLEELKSKLLDLL